MNSWFRGFFLMSRTGHWLLPFLNAIWLKIRIIGLVNCETMVWASLKKKKTLRFDGKKCCLYVFIIYTVRSGSVQHAIATCCKRRGKERKKLSNQSVGSLRVERKNRQIKAYHLCFVKEPTTAVLKYIAHGCFWVSS